VCIMVMDGKDAAAHSISYYGRLESNDVHPLVPACDLICVKTFCFKRTYVSHP
jgi:hypothetical protein